MTLSSRPGLRMLAGIAASAALFALYAQGGVFHPLGFVALVPWLLALDAASDAASAQPPESRASMFPGIRSALRDGWWMSIAFVLAVLGWFGVAIGAYVGIGAVPGLLIAALAAPLLQPQLLTFALARRLAAHRYGVVARTLIATAVWVATEWLWPKLLGDTLGHGLHASPWLRQAADLGGAAGLTVVLLLCNEAIAAAIRRRRGGIRALLPPLAVAGALPLVLAVYGNLRLSTLAEQDAQATSLRVGMVQTAIVDYERLRREMGAYAVVRLVLDTHYAMSREALARERVDALLWSETVYPTTFTHPKSEAGGELDREILDFVASAGVPTVFGTYDLDAQGEYNAAAFVEPDGGLLGFYRKSKPFPLTEYVPPWLDGPALRRALPWAGTWAPGNGPRVMPLRLADGREIPVLPLICLDDVDAQLGIDGARLGAQAILGMSNDSWFSAYPIGAELHLAVATFRSIETRLPQVRVTANGLSAAIDASGEVVARAPMGERALLVGEVRVREPTPTLMMAWGDWVGRAALALLGVFALGALLARSLRGDARALASASRDERPYRAHGAVLSPVSRVALALMRGAAGAGLLWIGAGLLVSHATVDNPLELLRLFAATVLAPLAAAWALQRAQAADLRIEDDRLWVEQRERRTEIPLSQIETAAAWRLPFPGDGVALRLRSGPLRTIELAVEDPGHLLAALHRAGAQIAAPDPTAPTLVHAAARADAPRWRIDAPIFKFVMFALVPALPAFRLHQIIAYGGVFGEYHSFGLQAYLIALLLWWAQWVVHLAAFGAWLRLGIEAVCRLAAIWRPAVAPALRRKSEAAGRLLFFVGIPAWLLVRLLG